jgi:hypothetical protein
MTCRCQKITRAARRAGLSAWTELANWGSRAGVPDGDRVATRFREAVLVGGRTARISAMPNTKYGTEALRHRGIEGRPGHLWSSLLSYF